MKLDPYDVADLYPLADCRIKIVGFSDKQLASTWWSSVDCFAKESRKLVNIHRTRQTMMLPSLQASILLLISFASAANAFVPMASRSGHGVQPLSLKIPSFGVDDNDNKEGEKEEEKQIGLAGFVQLFTAGLGAPFLGDYEGYDKETNSFMFSLEANNFVDEVCA
jgi:hypothetical protein